MSDFNLQTARLILRPHAYEDVQFMMELNSDPLVVRYTGETQFKSEDEARELVTSLIAQFERKKMGRFIVSDRESGEKLGWCGLKWHEEEQVADLGYRFLSRYWNKGFATEAARSCLSYGFGELSFSEIVAHAQAENLPSIRILEKLGFKKSGPTVCGGMNAEGFVLTRQRHLQASIGQ